MELRKNEIKLFSYLYHHQRESITKIAKEMGIKRTQVEYALNKFFREGVIKIFFTMYNYRAFGYNAYALVFVKLKNYSSFQRFTKKLSENKHCISWGRCFNKYDLYTNLIFKDKKEMKAFLLKVKYLGVKNMLVLNPYLAEFHPISSHNEKEKIILPIISPMSKEKDFSKTEIEIMKILQHDGRIKLTEIANKIGISAERVLQTIRRLRKENIILGLRAHTNMKILGYSYAILLINIKNLTQKTKDKILIYSKMEERVNAVALSRVNPKCLIQILHKTEEELRTEIEKLKELLKEESFDIEVLLVEEEEKIKTLPFLQ